MINSLIELSVKNRAVVLVFTIFMAILGWSAYQTLPIDAVPDITNVQVQINTPVKGLMPSEIEKFVTFPIESGMGGVPDIEEMRSISRFGLSQVTIVFKEGTDIYRARQLVSEKLQNIQRKLPGGVQPVMGPISTGLGEIYFYSLEAKEPKKNEQERIEQLMEIRSINEWTIQPRLLTVKGVAEVNTIGGFEKQFFVQPRMDDLSRYGIHLHELVEAIKSNNRNTGGGYIQQTAEQLLIQANGLLQSVEDIRNIPIKKMASFETVSVKDIADVRLDKEIRTGAALINGEEAVQGTVLMLLNENSRSVSIDVDERVREIQKSLPDWVEMKILYNRSDLVNSTLSTVQHNLLYGALLVALLLLILLGDLRVAVITVITIPLALLATFIWMKVFNISGNLMSLGALDFGIIIDGAVIVIDNCVRVVRKRANALGKTLSREEIQKAVIDATIEIRSAAGFGQIIIVIVFLPLFALTGVESKMFTPMAATFCFALGSAFVLSFSTIPALAAMFLSGKQKDKEPYVMRLFSKIYAPIISLALRFKFLIIGFGVASIITGGILFSKLGADFLPQLDEGSIVIQFVRPTNISIDQSIELQSLSEKIILEFKEIDKVFSRIGVAEIATDPMGVNMSDTFVMLKDKKLWPEIKGKKRSKEELILALKQILEESIPGQALIFSQPLQLRFNELLEGVRTDVSFKVFGEDIDVLSEIATKAASIIKKVEGAGDTEAEIKGKSPVLRITPDTKELSNLGISKENVLTTVETAIGGTEAGHLYQGVMKFPIIVRLSEKDRSDIESIKKVPVGVSDNLTVPIDKVASVKIAETYSDIRRESAKKRVAVLINVRGRDTQSFVSDAKAQIEAKLEIPSGYYVEWGGSFKNLEKAKSRLMFLVPLALALVLFMIYLAFGSILQTLVVASCIPMAMVGGVIALLINGLEFSISAAVGFIALSGIAVLNGVVLVSYFNQLKLSGETGDDLIKKGTSLRLRPVMMTALTDVFGFVPMMLATGAGASVQRPLATVVVGGIISATILTLIVLPVVYRSLESRMSFKGLEAKT
jgi:cobalt-zinc-cadmium resistance protein CzcA